MTYREPGEKPSEPVYVPNSAEASIAQAREVLMNQIGSFLAIIGVVLFWLGLGKALDLGMLQTGWHTANMLVGSLLLFGAAGAFLCAYLNAKVVAIYVRHTGQKP